MGGTPKYSANPLATANTLIKPLTAMPDRYPAASLITPHILSVTSENFQRASGRVLSVAACPQGKSVGNPY